MIDSRGPSPARPRLCATRAALLALTQCLALALAPTSAGTPAEESWTLPRALERALAVAPSLRAARAEIEARAGSLRQAGLWANPTIDLRADDKVAREQGGTDTEFSQFAINQAIPLSGHIGHRRAAARAELDSARAAFDYRRLLLETEVAERYHQLQLTAAHWRVARDRLAFADQFQRIGQRRQRAGDMARLESMRLDLLREHAQQIAERAEGEYSEALSQLCIYLDLPASSVPTPQPQTPVSAIPELDTLRTGLTAHPALRAAEFGLAAARNTVEQTRAERIPDPELRFFRDRDVLAGGEQTITGFGIGISVPLWDRSQGRLAEVNARVSQAQADLDALRRDLTGRLLQSHTHLRHLVSQERHFRTAVLEPARVVFELTGRAYRSGEADILALIDANDGWFDAQDHHAELLQLAGREAAQLRLAAGRPLAAEIEESAR